MFDSEHRYISPPQATQREWTRLDFNKCPHCPLQSSSSPQCPVARNLDSVVEDSKSTLSYTRAVVTVVTKEKSTRKPAPPKRGCAPCSGFLWHQAAVRISIGFGPLARFHLPFGDADESLFRILSLQLLEAFFSGKGDSMPQCAKEIEAQIHERQLIIPSRNASAITARRTPTRMRLPR